VTDNNLNKKFFTETDCPVPIIPTNAAWNDMREKLEAQMPAEKKKRRLLFWIPLMERIGLTLLLVGASATIWLTYHHKVAKNNGEYASAHTDATSKSEIEQHTDSNKSAATDITVPQQSNTITANNINNEKWQEIAAESPPKVTLLNLQKPILTANNSQSQRVRQRRQVANLAKKSTATDASQEQELHISRLLPVALPHPLVVENSIDVQSYNMLPGKLLSSATGKNKPPKKAIDIEAGIQWQWPVPFSYSDYYFKGPGGNNRPYRLLLPGGWLAITKNKQRLMVSVNPFMSTSMPGNSKTGALLIDSSGLMIGHKSMIQMFGYTVGVNYAYQVQSHWWVGAGINANWWQKGLLLAKPVDSLSNFKPYLYTVNARKEEGIRSFQVSTGIELGYQHNAWQAVLQVNRPLNATINNLPTPVWWHVGVRWRWWHACRE